MLAQEYLIKFLHLVIGHWLLHIQTVPKIELIQRLFFPVDLKTGAKMFESSISLMEVSYRMRN